MSSASKRRFTFPHPFVLLVGGILLAALLTYIVPAGKFERREDAATGRSVVVAKTYHSVPATPVGPFDALVSIPQGMADAASVVFFVFLVGGAFGVVDETGVLRIAMHALAGRLGKHAGLVIPVTCAVFAVGGALENLQEEIIPMVPVILLLCRRFGYDTITAAAISIGAASVGSAFSPVNPFQVGIAQKLAQLPPVSGGVFRTVFLVLAVALWTWATWRHARTTRTAPDATAQEAQAALGVRSGIILALVLAAFATFIYGVVVAGWGFDQMAALFFAMGAAAGLIAGLGLSGTAEAFVQGFRSMTFAALLIGFSRGIYTVMEHGQIVDTLVNSLFSPLENWPVAAAAGGMMAVHTLIHFPVPSVSGHAVLTLPVLVPLSDLLGLSRQVTVLAYQYGAGLCELLTPTNGALMAIIGALGLSYGRWLRFVIPVYLALFALGYAAVIVAIALRLV